MNKNSAIIFLILLILLSSCSSNIPFDKELWQSEDSTYDENNKPTIRQKMVDDVIKLAEGRTEQEIIEILGEETDTDKYEYLDRTLVYVLGPERSFFSIDYEWLLLEFDEDNKLVSHEIVRD